VVADLIAIAGNPAAASKRMGELEKQLEAVTKAQAKLDNDRASAWSAPEPRPGRHHQQRLVLDPLVVAARLGVSIDSISSAPPLRSARRCPGCRTTALAAGQPPFEATAGAGGTCQSRTRRADTIP
jgi:hypothetical protein